MFSLKWLSNTSIFRRLFLAFALAAVVSGSIITVLGTTYINILTARGQAEQTNNGAMKLVTSQLSVLQHRHDTDSKFLAEQYLFQQACFAAAPDDAERVSAMAKIPDSSAARAARW